MPGMPLGCKNKKKNLLAGHEKRAGQPAHPYLRQLLKCGRFGILGFFVRHFLQSDKRKAGQASVF